MFSELVESFRIFGRSPRASLFKLLFTALLLLVTVGVANLVAASYPIAPAVSAGNMALVAPGPTLVFGNALKHLDSGVAPGTVLVGTTFAAWILSLPFWLLHLLLFAWLGPGYFALQAERSDARAFTPPLNSATRVGAAHVLSSVATLCLGAIGSLPGLLLAILLGLSNEPFWAELAPILAFVGGVLAWAFARIQLAFVERAAALDGLGALAALRRSTELATGRRRELLMLWTLTGSIRLASAMPWFFLLGFLTHPAGWVIADTMWTQRYLRLTEEPD